MRWIRYLPCITFVWMTTTLVIAFLLATIYQKEVGLIPDLTKVRALEPTGSIIGCLLHISAKLIMITVSTRHKIVKLQLWCSWRKNKLANIMNMVSWILGTIMALLFAIQSSVSITIKEAQRIFSFHIMYALPLLYLISQTTLECLLKWGDRKVRKLNVIRIGICILYAGMFMVGVTLLYIWFERFNFELDNEDSNRDDYDYYLYKISAALSWMRVFLLAFYIFLFRYDFRKTDWLFTARHWYPQGTTFRALNIKDFYI